MNQLRQDVRDAWLAGITLKEILRCAGQISMQAYAVICTEYHKCDKQMALA